MGHENHNYKNHPFFAAREVVIGKFGQLASRQTQCDTAEPQSKLAGEQIQKNEG